MDSLCQKPAATTNQDPEKERDMRLKARGASDQQRAASEQESNLVKGGA